MKGSTRRRLQGLYWLYFILKDTLHSTTMKDGMPCNCIYSRSETYFFVKNIKGSFVHNQCFLSPPRIWRICFRWQEKDFCIGCVQCKCEVDTTRQSGCCTKLSCGRLFLFLPFPCSSPLSPRPSSQQGENGARQHQY